MSLPPDPLAPAKTRLRRKRKKAAAAARPSTMAPKKKRRRGGGSPPSFATLPGQPIPIPSGLGTPACGKAGASAAETGSAAATPVKLNAFRMIEALRDRTLPELQQQWLNVNEKLAKAETDELLRFRSAVTEEWGRRYQLALSDPDRFEWPSTLANPGDGVGIWIARNAEGMLSYLGYRVGVTKGLTENTRRRILDGIFSGGLPPLNGPDYVKAWAAPRSAPRLKRIVEEVARLAIDAKRKRSANMDSAISDWEGDLAYLHWRYYVGHFAFAWPRLG